MNLDPWVTCPYDKVHRVPQSRLQGHIVKCQKKYPQLAICPYNATHRMSIDELKEHMPLCPSRLEITPEKPWDKNRQKHGAIHTPKPFLQKEILPETDPDYEIWDD